MAGLLACSAPEPDPPAVPAWSPPVAPEHLQVYTPSGDGVRLALQFTGTGTLYRGWVADPTSLQPLAEALEACVEGTPSLSTSYDESSRVGRFALVVPAHQLRCPAVGDLDLSPLLPVTRALATWRNGLAATRDMRIYAFRTALHVEDRRGAVTLWLDGQDPVDGSAVHPCVGLDGVERCGANEGGALDAVTTLRLSEPAEQRRLRELLTASGG